MYTCKRSYYTRWERVRIVWLRVAICMLGNLYDRYEEKYRRSMGSCCHHKRAQPFFFTGNNIDAKHVSTQFQRVTCEQPKLQLEKEYLKSWKQESRKQETLNYALFAASACTMSSRLIRWQVLFNREVSSVMFRDQSLSSSAGSAARLNDTTPSKRSNLA